MNVIRQVVPDWIQMKWNRGKWCLRCSSILQEMRKEDNCERNKTCFRWNESTVPQLTEYLNNLQLKQKKHKVMV